MPLPRGAFMIVAFPGHTHLFSLLIFRVETLGRLYAEISKLCQRRCVFSIDSFYVYQRIYT